MEPLMLLSIIASFLITFIALPIWIKKAKQEGLFGKDINKPHKPVVAEGGGFVVLGGAAIGILLYIAFNTFRFGKTDTLISIFALLSVLFISSIVGIVDDFLGWKKGLNKWVRILLVLFAAVPLMAINAGTSTISGINLGLLYPLIIIPLGVVGATVTFNFLAGYNGLEASQGIILLSALAIVTFLVGSSWLSVLALCMVAALLGFLVFNMYPAKIFPGDVMTYAVGAMIASIAILGNIEKIALFFFIPYILETILKARGKLKKESFAKVNEDGSLEMPYEKVYGLEHLAIKVLKKIKPSGKAYEKEVVWVINIFQIIIIALGFWIFL